MIQRLPLFCLSFLLLACGCGSHSGMTAARDGMTAFKEGRYEKAVSCFTRATTRISNSSELYYNLGLAHLKLGNIEPAQLAFQAAVELSPKNGSSLACLGQISYLQNDLSNASVFLEKAAANLSDAQALARALTTAGLVETARQRYSLARLNYLRALKLDRHYAPAYYNLASLYRDQFGLREEALDQFELFIRITDAKNDHYEKAANNIKRLRLNLERTRSTEGDRVRRDPPTAAKFLQDGVAAAVSKNYSKAIKAYKDALAADPLTFSAAFGLGMAYRQQRQPADAFAAFKQAAAISPNHQDSYCQAAELALQLRQPGEAAKLLDKALARSPYNPASAKLMAQLCHAENRLPEARAYGEFYLSLIPEKDPNRIPYQKWIKALPTK